MEQDLSIIVKNLWESVDRIVEKYKQELNLLNSYKNNYNDNEVLNYDTFEFITYLIEQNQTLRLENEELLNMNVESSEKLKDINQLSLENDRLKVELVKYSNEKSNLISQLNDYKKAEKDIEFTKLEIARKNKELNTKVTELNALKEEIASKDMMIYKLNNSGDSSDESSEKMKILEEEIANLNKKLNKRDEEIKEQKFMIDEFNQRLLHFNEEKYNMNTQIESLKGRVEVCTIKLERAESEKSRCEQRINELIVYQKLSEKRGEEIDEMSVRINNIEQEKNNCLAEIQRLEGEMEVAKLSQGQNDLSQNIDFQKITEEKEYYREKLKKAEIILAEINRQMNDKERVIEELKGQQNIFQIEANDKEIAEKQSKIEELENKLDEITKGLKDQNGNIQNYEDIIGENDRLKTDLQLIKNNNQNLESIALSRLNEIKQLQIKIDEYSSKYKSIQKDKMIKDVDNLIKRLEKFAV
jgi:chromosome segregation ATPase